MKVRPYDMETFIDATVIVFKHHNQKIYDVFVKSDIIPITIGVIQKLSYKKGVNVYDFSFLNNYIDLDIKKSFYLYGFNNQFFDNPILTHIYNGSLITCNEIYLKAQSIIKKGKLPGLAKFKSDFWDNQLPFKYLDGFKINHYDNGARRTSLKKLEFTYRANSIEDLPFSHLTSITTISKLIELIKYCCIDTDNTDINFNKTKPRIKSRILINKEYRNKVANFNCLNWSDVKLGQFRSLYAYAQATNQTIKEVNNIQKPDYGNNFLLDYSKCIPDYIQFTDPTLQSWLNNLKQKKTYVGKPLSEQVEFNNVVYTFGAGGIHSVDPGRLLIPNDDEILCEIDVGGQYPSFLIKSGKYPRHLSKEWNDTLKSDYFERLNKWKPLSKTDDFAKTKSEEIKLSLNGGRYGKLGETFSSQYDPELRLAVCLTCQLEILMLNEMLSNIGVIVYSSNTDGSLVKYNKSIDKLFWEICHKWEEIILSKKYNVGLLEQTKYKLFAQTTVNDYIAIKENNQVKRKGDFMTYEDIENDNWHKNASSMIIPKAIEQYFLNNTPIEETIYLENNIHEFLIGATKTSAFRFLFTSDSKNGKAHELKFNDNRFIRYYMGGGTTISKMFLKNGSNRITETLTRLESSGKVTICNKFRTSDIYQLDPNVSSAVIFTNQVWTKKKINFPNLDYSWYINKCNEMLQNILEK